MHVACRLIGNPCPIDDNKKHKQDMENANYNELGKILCNNID